MKTKDNIHLIVGRFNPLTVYHRDVIEQIAGPCVIAITGSIGPKDPLPLNLKMRLTQEVVDSQHQVNPRYLIPAKDVLDAVRTVGLKFNCPNVILHCGSDRAGDYQRLNTYAHETGVESISVVGYEREHENHSATYLRSLAVNGMYDEFMSMCGYAHRADCILVYDAIRSYYASVQG